MKRSNNNNRNCQKNTQRRSKKDKCLSNCWFCLFKRLISCKTEESENKIGHKDDSRSDKIDIPKENRME